MSDISAILDARAKVYGDFSDLSLVAQDLKSTLRKNYRETEIEPFQAEALDLISTKLARIVCGDANHIDSWADICGYAQLVVDKLKERT